MPDTITRTAAGAAAGFAATAPMTAFMAAAHRLLPAREQYPLPPRQITERAAEAVGVEDDLSESERTGLTLAVHFAYGAGAGAVYGLVAPRLPLGPAGSGVAFGLAVWAGSYLGWLPAAGVLPPATQAPVHRTALMVGAHVVWGAALGWAADRLLGGHPGRRGRADG